MQPAIATSFLCLTNFLAHGAPLIRTANSADTTMEISSSGSVGILRHGDVQSEASDGQAAQHAQSVVKPTGDVDQSFSSDLPPKLRQKLVRQAPVLDLKDLQDPDDDIKPETSTDADGNAAAPSDGPDPPLEQPYIPDNETKPDIPDEDWAKPFTPSSTQQTDERFHPEPLHPTEKTVNKTLLNGTNWDAVIFNETFDDKILDGGGVSIGKGSA